jgi:hypothetical protein
MVNGNKKCFFVLGITCSGKDYLIDYAISKHPEKFGVVQVGREFRKRYPPEYFKGSGAPDHTEVEALEIYKEQFTKALGKPYILVSSQPRRPSQVQPCVEHCLANDYQPVALFLYAPGIVVTNRIESRFKDDESGKTLAQARVTNDKVQFYDTIFELLKLEEQGIVKIVTLDQRDQRVEEAIDSLAHWGYH